MQYIYIHYQKLRVHYQKLKICAIEMNLQTTEWGLGGWVSSELAFTPSPFDQ